MLTKTKQTPAEERARIAREAVQVAEDAARGHRTDLAAHEAEVERQRAAYNEWRKTVAIPVDFAFYPSQGEGRERGERGLRLTSELQAAESRLRLTRERLQRADRMAGPMSKAARARLEELASWAVADAELGEMLGANPCEVLVSPGGKDRILAFARDHGMEVDE